MNPTNELYQSFQRAYSFFNRALFDSELPDVIFTVQRKKGALGYFAPNLWESKNGRKAHEIAINPLNLTHLTLIDVLSTLAHEMVHCWQFCYGNPSRSGYHNKEWANKMMEIGLHPSSTRQPGGKVVGQKMSHYPISEGKFMLACEMFIAVQGEDALPMSYSISQGITSFMGISRPNPLQMPFAKLIDLERYASSVQGNKKKITYICNRCRTKVWGKPGLRLICGKCESPYHQIKDSRKVVLKQGLMDSDRLTPNSVLGETNNFLFESAKKNIKANPKKGS